MPTFHRGDKIKCNRADRSNGALVAGVVYTVASDSRPGAKQEVVTLDEVPAIAWHVSRFERVIEKRPTITIDAEGVRLINPSGTLEVAIPADVAALKPGDWIHAIGQVIRTDGPGEILVEFFSRNEQWSGWIENKRIVKAPAIPDWAAAQQCTAMTVNVLDTNVFYRCEKPEHRRFDKEHKSGAHTWTDGDNSGFFEEA